MRLSPAQYKALSEITGNIAVAWFSIGFISPFFLKSPIGHVIISIIIGLGMTIVFSIISVSLVQER